MNENLVKAARLIGQLAELAKQDESVNSLVTRSWGIKGDERDNDHDEQKPEPTSEELNEILSLMGLDN